MPEKIEGVLTMVLVSGFFLIGRLISGNKLSKPRIFQVIDDGKRIQMSPLPGTPPFMRVGLDASSYVVPEKESNIVDLYARVTDPKVDPGE